MSTIVITLDSKDIEQLLKGWPVQMDVNRNLDYRNLCGVEIHTELGLPPKLKNLVEVTRCKDCKYYIPFSDIKKDSYYSGFCTNFNRGTDKEDYCRSAKRKDE